MFHYDRGLMLTKAGLAVDIPRRQKCAFVSHAHNDHMARHELALCTPTTGKLYQQRLGKRLVREMKFGEPLEWGGLRLTAYPSGHCWGGAMLLAEDGERSLLYTGDFKLEPSLTAEPAQLPQADLLVMESTYGEPQYRRPPREQVVEMLLDAVRGALRRGQQPVVLAYALGKAQEVTKILTTAGIPVLQHRTVHALSLIYEQQQMPLGNFQLYPGRYLEGHAVVMPPRFHAADPPPGLKRPYWIAATGWAAVAGTRARWCVDAVIPLSDHADYDELLTAAQQVAPREIYCTHGPISFVERLRDLGHNAYRLENGRQLRLF